MKRFVLLPLVLSFSFSFAAGRGVFAQAQARKGRRAGAAAPARRADSKIEGLLKTKGIPYEVDEYADFKVQGRLANGGTRPVQIRHDVDRYLDLDRIYVSAEVVSSLEGLGFPQALTQYLEKLNEAAVKEEGEEEGLASNEPWFVYDTDGVEYLQYGEFLDVHEIKADELADKLAATINEVARKAADMSKELKLKYGPALK